MYDIEKHFSYFDVYNTGSMILLILNDNTKNLEPILIVENVQNLLILPKLQKEIYFCF